MQCSLTLGTCSTYVTEVKDDATYDITSAKQVCNCALVAVRCEILGQVFADPVSLGICIACRNTI